MKKIDKIVTREFFSSGLSVSSNLFLSTDTQDDILLFVSYVYVGDSSLRAQYFLKHSNARDHAFSLMMMTIKCGYGKFAFLL